MNSTSITYTIVERRLRQVSFKLTAVKLLLFFLLLIWCAGIIFPLLSPNFAGKLVITEILNYAYSLVCHQTGSDLLLIDSNHLLVCTRCTGLYFGALIFIILLIVKPFKVKWGLKPFFFFSAPLIVDAIAIRLGIYNYSAAFTFVTGLMCGAITIIYIINTLKNSFLLAEDKKYGL
ncbi:MAG: DUF2085 domain-containing protein [Bacteroidetes bacterium]|nr:DUF2085 domain-containing protein [Bacteroidota bacterium]